MADFSGNWSRRNRFRGKQKNGRPYLGRMPVFNAVALFEVIYVFSAPAFPTLRSSVESKQFLLSQFRVCFEEALPFVKPARRVFAPSGAQVEGLIHTARCWTKKLLELLAPALSGPCWPGGPDSPVMVLPPFVEEAFGGRAPLLSPPGPKWEA
jgi:hypothetical protein